MTHQENAKPLIVQQGSDEAAKGRLLRPNEAKILRIGRFLIGGSITEICGFQRVQSLNATPRWSIQP